MNHDQTILLAKLLTAVAWADNYIDPREVDLVNYFFKNSDRISNDDRLTIDLYFEYPLSRPEVAGLIQKFKESFTDRSELQSALLWLKRIIKITDGIDTQKVDFYTRLLHELKTPSTSQGKGLSDLFKSGMSRAPFTVQATLGRDRHLDDYLHNPVYFRVYQIMSSGQSDVKIEFDEDQLRVICLGFSIVSRVVLDRHVLFLDKRARAIDELARIYKMNLKVSELILNEALLQNERKVTIERQLRRYMELSDGNDRKELFEVLHAVASEGGEDPVKEVNLFNLIVASLKLPDIVLHNVMGPV